MHASVLIRREIKGRASVSNNYNKDMCTYITYLPNKEYTGGSLGARVSTRSKVSMASS